MANSQLFASGLFQRGNVDDDQDILKGFLSSDILKEKRRADKLVNYAFNVMNYGKPVLLLSILVLCSKFVLALLVLSHCTNVYICSAVRTAKRAERRPDVWRRSATRSITSGVADKMTFYSSSLEHSGEDNEGDDIVQCYQIKFFL